MSASGISETASIPYSKVYSVLRGLEAKGWVEVQRGRPSLYYPKAPSDVVKAERVKADSRFRTYEELILSELQPLYEKVGIREKPDIWIIRGKVNIPAKVREVLGKAKNELMIALPTISDVIADVIAPMLSHLKGAGVRIMFLTSEGVQSNLIQEISSIVTTRTREGMFGGGIIADGREAILLLGEAERADSTLAVWSDHVGLAHVAEVYFRYLWKGARPAKEKAMAG